jgi:hypothetical protein
MRKAPLRTAPPTAASGPSLRTRLIPRLLQHTNGKRAVQRVLYAQPKLTVGASGDAFEQEADRVADHVMRMPEPQLQRDCACGGECSDCQKKDRLQTQRINAEERGEQAAPAIVQEALRSPGRPLDSSTRGFMESRFGQDFSQVRVHTGAAAAESARAVRAQAFTVGRDVAFGEGQYAPQTSAGRRLLAHELTHVLHQNGVPKVQRQSTSTSAPSSTSTPAKTYPYSVKTEGCDVAPYTVAGVEAAAKTVFTTVRDGNCVKTADLKKSILAEFNGLTIKCRQGKDKPCGRASSYFSQTVKIFPSVFESRCGPLESTILHEVVHLTEWNPWAEGDLASACEESCFPWGSGGDPSKCTFERSFVPAIGFSAGKAFPGKGASTGYARLYLGMEKRGPVLSFVHPSLGIGFGLIGETTTGGPGAVSSGSSTLVSLLGGLRLDPGKVGGASVSFFGGPALIGISSVGAEAGVALGYRWSWLDVSVDAGFDYDPTRETGMDKFFTLGASLRIGPRIMR